ncbi:hypothetical protein BURPS1710b_A1291 [Burkholderia pseudomallei 1710b]|uniref:Uncharacterized protein n=1 Tax=Burkholderia pseudomallei (strain 1710b) TaxID=320372 RepID=Q3JJ06_BURP1|nr:hypothetical protein BURPS1710b_A1291 [Burkholderia pseudomallei 1710b]
MRIGMQSDIAESLFMQWFEFLRVSPRRRRRFRGLPQRSGPGGMADVATLAAPEGRNAWRARAGGVPSSRCGSSRRRATRGRQTRSRVPSTCRARRGQPGEAATQCDRRAPGARRWHDRRLAAARRRRGTRRRIGSGCDAPRRLPPPVCLDARSSGGRPHGRAHRVPLAPGMRLYRLRRRMRHPLVRLLRLLRSLRRFVLAPPPQCRSEQLAEARVECGHQPIDVFRARLRTHEHHVVERRDQHAAVQQIQVHDVLELAVELQAGDRAVARRRRRELELGARADPRHAPWQPASRDRLFEPGREPCGEVEHVRVRGIGHHVGERRADRAHRQHVRGQRRADARMAGRRARLRVLRALGARRAEAVHRARHAAADRLADDEQIRLEPVRERIAAGAAADRMGFVDREQRAVAARERARFAPEAGVGQHHADVRQRRLGEHACDLAVLQRGFERGEIVEFDDARVCRQIVRLAEQAVALHRPAVCEIDEHVVDGAVIAAVEHDDVLAARGRARPAQHEAVRVARAQRELPVRQPEAARELRRDPRGVLARQHRRVAARRLLGERACDGLGRVAEHRARVAQAEVGVAMAVDVGEMRAARVIDIERERRRPVAHPVQRHAEQQMLRGFGRARARFRHRPFERVALACEKRAGARQVDSVANLQDGLLVRMKRDRGTSAKASHIRSDWSIRP